MPKIMRTLLLSALASSALLVLALVPTISFAKAPVWKVSKDDQYLYIGGTIHVLSKKDYPLPSAFDTAFDDSALVIFETDIAGLSSPANQAKLAGAMMSPDGTSLESSLSEETYAKLNAFLAERQMSIENFAQFTPGGISMVLSVIELQRIGIATAGVDEHFSARTQNADKQSAYLETIDDQVGFLRSFSTLDGDKIIESTLRDLGNINTEWKLLLDSWRRGDVRSLENLAINKMQEEFPKRYQFILADRNDQWVAKIKPMLDSEEVEFLLVGALHLAGDHSVLTQLSNAGYKVEQLD